MGALAYPPLSWIPEDDLALKNAIEAGASLESLAKGAVQFSRRFSVKELQDRWISLLYDPIVSTKAAQKMLDLERSTSKSNRLDNNSKASKIPHVKRKAESVRTCFYAMRKRVCHHPFNNADLSYLVGPPEPDNCFLNGPQPPGLGDPMGGDFELELDGFDCFHNLNPQVMREGAQSCGVSEYPIVQHHNAFGDHMESNAILASNMAMKENPSHNVFDGSGIQSNQLCSRSEGNAIFNPSMSDCGNSFDHLQYTSPMHEMSDWNVSIRGKNLTTRDPFLIPNDGDAGGPSEYDVMHTESELNNQIPCDDFKISTFQDLSDALFNFGTDDDDMLAMDGGKAYFNNINTILLDSPNDVSEERLPNMLGVKKLTTEGECIDIPSSTGPEEKNDTVDLHSGNINIQITSENSIPICTPCAVNSKFPEFCNGVICCTLNTEDPEIPCNDDVLPNRPRSSSLKRTQSEAKNSSLHGKDNTGIQSSGKGLPLKKEQRRVVESHPSSQIEVQDVGSSCAVDELGAKYETPRAVTINGLMSQSLQAVKTELSEIPLSRQPSDSFVEKPSQVAVGGSNLEGQTSSGQRNQDLQALGPLDCMALESGGEPFLSDAEEQLSDFDSDIPSFSDVESMILEMDLGPEDQDSCKEVAIYQREPKEVRRLEQNAHAKRHRDLASHGALALLYGRHSRHYIKKAEVSLGRATDDVPVDIDLGKEGRANKISRRQAIIRMDEDGAFNIKNAGKCSIYVNGKEIFPGQSLGLHPDCLIEIREMTFIFETSQARIKQYLENAARKLADRRPNI